MAITAMIAATLLASVSGGVPETAFGLILVQAPVCTSTAGQRQCEGKGKGPTAPMPRNKRGRRGRSD